MDETTDRTNVSAGTGRRGTGDAWLLMLLAAIPLVLEILSSLTRGYSYFIDEFYYLACARRLAFGYVDHPPLAPLLLALTRPIFGESPLAIRVLPFLAGSATVWVAGVLARRLGGGRFAVVLAGLSVGLLPVLLTMNGFFSMNAFEPLLWTLTMLAVVRILQTGNSKLWLVVGLLIGLGFENKHTLLAFVFALGVGILATRARRVLLDRWLWAGAGVALAVALPNILWQAANGWPALEFYSNAQALKNVYSPPLRSIITLAIVSNPVALPIWLGGVAWLLVARDVRGLRALGIASLVVLIEYVASGTSRADRPVAAFPFMLAAGSVAMERWLRWRAARVSLAAALVLMALIAAPIAIPLLPPEATAQYVRALGFNLQIERGKTSPLPQPLADRTGWESFIDDMAGAYNGLPPEERRQAIIYVPDYGHAGALELWGPARGLPRVICPHNTYWHWSEGHVNTPVLIATGVDPRDLRAVFRDVREVGLVQCEYCMSWRNQMRIWIARDPSAPLESLWPRARHYE